MRNKILILAALLLPCARVVRAADEEALASFEKALDALRIQYRIPGLSAAIVKNQQIIWEKGFGFADVERRIPAAPDTPYLLASVTKTFTSTLLMQCVEKGVLNLDDPISKYTVAVPGPGITVRHILTHTSESVPPGEAFLYSSRFVALTPVVEACSGRPFREALAKNILHPLKMLDSVPGHDLENITPALARTLNPEIFDRATLVRYQRALQRLATPYAVDSLGQAHPSPYPDKTINTSVGLISTVRDLALYDAAIDRHVLVRPETQELAWQPHVTSRGQVLPYALGWYSETISGKHVVWHPGTWIGAFSALYVKVPERNMSLILLANCDTLTYTIPVGGNLAASPFVALFLRMLDQPGAWAKDSPAIAANGVVNAASLKSEVAPGGWATIFGQNFTTLEPPGRTWRPDEIADGLLPTSLAGVTVYVDGKLAPIQFAGPGQLNVQIPNEVSPGRASVEVNGPTGNSRSLVAIKELAPGLFTFGDCRGRVYAAAVNTEGTPLGSPDCIQGAQPAQPGDAILLFGTGFGPTSPSRPSGRLIEPAPLALPFNIRIGGLPAVAEYGGIVGPGLYQFNVRVPQLPGGDHVVSIEVAGEQTQPAVFVPITEISMSGEHK